MSQSALYRKYRSLKLDEVVGQDHIVKPLQNALEQGKINHAYLFTGDHGIGKTSVARIIAHEINDLKYDDTSYVDIIEIDAASNRRIEEIRDLREKVHIAPVAAKYKVYIIDEVHMLTKEAFNALLKTLEEPPEHVVFILATTEMHKLPATIISRTQRFNFKKATEADLVSHLQTVAKAEKVSADKAALELIAKHANGSFRDGLSLLDQVSSQAKKIDSKVVEDLLGLADSDKIAVLFTALNDKSLNDLEKSLESIYETGVNPMQLITQLIDTLMQRPPTINTVELIEALIEASSSANPKLKLRTTLLKEIIDNDNNEVVTKVDNTKREQTAPQPPKPTIETKETTTDEPPQAKSIDANWKKLLEQAKTSKSKLYAVIRMAEPNYLTKENKLILKLKFPFHEKKLKDAENQAELSDLIKQIYNQDTRHTIEVNKAEPTAATNSIHIDQINGSTKSDETDKATMSKQLSDIASLMGGGEAVEFNG